MTYSTLRTRSRLRRVNPVRREKLRAEQFGPHGERVRALRCCACGALPPVDPAHAVKSRGAGGKAADQAPLCRRCHREQHAAGVETFQRERGVDLAEVAAMLAEVADWPRTACSAEDLARRLAAILFVERFPMLAAAPVKIPKSVTYGTVRELAEWLVAWDGAHEIGRVLDLWECLEGWRDARA